MTDTTNPYESPQQVTPPTRAEKVPQVDLLAFLLWPLLFAANLIVPLLFGLEVTRDYGRTGMFFACMILLFGGWALCFVNPPLIRRLLVGSVVTGLAQIFPILQILIGALAFGMAGLLGLTSQGGDFQEGPIYGELGGFVVTLLVGGGLLVFAGVSGLVLGLLLPQRWFTPKLELTGNTAVDHHAADR